MEKYVVLYNKLSGAIFSEQSAAVYKEGHNLYTNGDYQESLKVFEKALAMNPDNIDAIYFTARAYHRLNDIDTAVTYYNKLIEEYPGTGRAREAEERMSELRAEGTIE